MAAPPAEGDGVPPPPNSDATADTVVEPAPAPPRFRYRGVQRSPSGQWTAHVHDPDRRVERVIGTFPDEHAAALAHDRVAMAVHGEGAPLNFRPAFHALERQFLLRCGMRRGEIDVWDMVASGSYEAGYATFLRAVYAREDFGEFTKMMLEFYIDRAAQIGEEALNAGGKRLADRFVAMHRNRAIEPAWRRWYLQQVAARYIAEQQRQQNSSSVGLPKQKE